MSGSIVCIWPGSTGLAARFVLLVIHSSSPVSYTHLDVYKRQALSKPVQSQMVIMGDMSLGGTVVQVRNLAESLQVAFDAGAKKILLPMSSVVDIPTVPGELFAKFQTSFYSDPIDAVFKAIGIE